MFSVDIDIPNLRKLQNKLKGMPSMIDQNIKRYLSLLLGSGAVSIQGTLKKNINKLVYSSSKPKVYERTYSLFNSVRVKKEGNTVYLYIDDEWLSNRPHVQKESLETGTAINARPNSPVPYSMRVENDFHYKNKYTREYTRKGSDYMETTFYELLKDIQGGDKNAEKILEPILRSWSK